MTWGWVCFFHCLRVSRELRAAADDVAFVEDVYAWHAMVGKRQGLVLL